MKNENNIVAILHKIIRIRGELRWTISFVGFIILIARGTNLIIFPSSLGNAIINIFVSVILLGSILKDLVFPDEFQDIVQDLAISFVLGVSLIIIPGLVVLVLKGSLFLFINTVIAVYFGLLILSLLRLKRRRRQGSSIYEGNNYDKYGRLNLNNVDLETLALLIIFVAILSLVTYYLFSIASIWRTVDSWAFLAYIRKYLDISRLDPSNTINTILDGRVSLSAWLVVLTYIIKLSQDFSVTHYFLYLTPIFALLAIASFYTFAATLFKNKKIAIFATCIQILYFASSLMLDSDNIRGLGYALVDSIAEDKYFSVLVIMPIALLFAWRFFESRKRIDFTLFALTITTATLIHPIAYASTGLLLGSYLTVTLVWIIVMTIIQTKSKTTFFINRHQLLKILKQNIITNRVLIRSILFTLLFLLLLIPYLLMAKTDYEAGGSKGFNIEKAAEGDEFVIERISGRHLVFNSISSYRADVTLVSHPFMVLSICLSPLLIKYFIRRKAARYLLGSLIIPLLLIFNPWTATLIGKLITATQIWRLSWSFPVSLVIGYVLYQYMHSYLDSYRKNNNIQGLSTSQSAAIKSRAYLSSNFVSIVPSLAIMLLTILMGPRIRDGIAFIQDRKIYYVVPESEIQVGEFLRFNDGTKKTTLTDEITSRTLVGASSDLNMIRYRAQWPYDPELDKQMDYIFRQASSLDAQIIKFLDDYDVHYLILKNGVLISDSLESMPSIAKLVFENIDFKVFQITPDLQLSSTILGDISKINKDYEDAYAYYLNALENDPNNPFALLGMGRIKIEQGNRQSAIREYQKALTLLSEDKQVLQIISDDLDVEDIYTLNYVNKGELYRGPSPANETYNFIDHLEGAIKSSSNNETFIRQNVFIFNKIPVGILFQHAPSSVVFELEIPPRAWIQFSPVLAPEVWQFGKGDGVLFKIELETQDNVKHLIFEEYLDPKNIVSQRELITKSINLARWSGKSVKIVFSTGCGPNDDCRFDWSGWGEPRILQPVAYNFLDHFTEARTDLLGTETGQAEILTQSINYEERRILYQHPSSQIVYSIYLPPSASIQFGLGMSPEAWTAENSDGVEYTLYVRSLSDPYKLFRVFQRIIDPKNNPDDRRWFDERVDLSKFGGQAVEIIFEALPGQAGNFDFDWGGWSTPVLIDNSPPDTDD